jgi:hypothetical protein
VLCRRNFCLGRFPDEISGDLLLRIPGVSGWRGKEGRLSASPDAKFRTGFAGLFFLRTGNLCRSYLPQPSFNNAPEIEQAQNMIWSNIEKFLSAYQRHF